MESSNTFSKKKYSNVFDFSGNLINLTISISKHIGLSVAIFWKNDCVVCRRMHQILPSIYANNPDILFFSIEHEDNPLLFKEFEIKTVPLIIFLKGFSKEKIPKELDRMSGFNQETLKLKIMQYC